MAKTKRFSYISVMKSFCPHRILLLCFASMLIKACSGPQIQTKSDWESNVQKKLIAEQGQFQICSKYIRHTKSDEVKVSLTFRLNPTGALETLWLDESAEWDTQFYDCLFNVIDRMDFPAFEQDISLEVVQEIIYKQRV
jgi:hypothetical protein